MHSRYERRLADAAAAGRRVEIQLRVRQGHQADHAGTRARQETVRKFYRASSVEEVTATSRAGRPSVSTTG